MHRVQVLVAGAAAVLIAAAGIAPAWAYFTASDSAVGGIQISVAPTTDITEVFDSAGKHITVVNDATSTVPVFVRAQVFGDTNRLNTISGADWTGPMADDEGNTWYYYNLPVAPGDKTNPLDVSITFPRYSIETITNPDGSTTKETKEHEGENFNVIVVYEATPVQYGSSGEQFQPWDAGVNWHLKAEEA